MRSADWDALQGTIAGEVILPGSPDYDSGRRSAIARFHDARPEAIVRCETAADVSEAISFARRSGLRAAPRSGGHCFAGRSSTDGVVIDVSPLRSVSVANGVATIGAGARLGEVYDALLQHGVTIPAGCGPEVGIAGLTLGGGLGILGRLHGLTCDGLRAAQVVLADGRIVDCDERDDEELFWALRGAGGGHLGVVTSLVFETVPAPLAATSFHLSWPHAEAPAVIEAWQRFAPAAPDELAASVLVTAESDLDRPPAVNVFGALLGTEAEATALLGELVELAGAAPQSESLAEMSFRDTKRHLAEHGPGEDRPGAHPYSKSEFFRRPLPADAIAALVGHLVERRAPGQSRELDFTPWGGAYNRVPADATAFFHRDEQFLLKHGVLLGANASQAERDAARRWLARSWELAHPHGSGGVYPNFPDPDLPDWQAAYFGANYERLRRVKARYDPDGCFRFEQSLPAPARQAGRSAETPSDRRSR